MIPGGIPDKPKSRVRKYIQYEEAPESEYRIFIVGLLYILGVFMMVFCNKHDIYGLPSVGFLLGAVLCISVLFALILFFYKVYIYKKYINESI
jgi:predicted ferric reductase